MLYGGVEDRPDVSGVERVDEMQRVVDELGFSWDFLDNGFIEYRLDDLIGPIEQPGSPGGVWGRDRGDTVTLQVALPRVLVYEQPHTMLGPIAPAIEAAAVCEIDMRAKLAACGCPRSSNRRRSCGAPRWDGRSPRALA